MGNIPALHINQRVSLSAHQGVVVYINSYGPGLLYGVCRYVIELDSGEEYQVVRWPDGECNGARRVRR